MTADQRQTRSPTRRRVDSRDAARAFRPGESLEGRHVDDIDLSGCDLSGACFERATFTRVNLAGANLASAVLSHAVLTDVDLSDANCTRSDLANGFLVNAYVRQDQLQRSNADGSEREHRGQERRLFRVRQVDARRQRRSANDRRAAQGANGR